MKRRVVDCNVAVVANGRDTNASHQCRLKAIEALSFLLRRGQIIIDTDGAMLDQYRTYCEPRGQPGVGDRFFREVLMNYGNRVERITLPRRPDGSYEDFPDDPALAGFDPSDRVYAAAARQTSAPVLNACDTDWLEHLTALMRHGIRVDFACGTNHQIWFAPETGSP